MRGYTIIENETAYANAIQERIKANARKGRGKRWLAEDESRIDLVKKMSAHIESGRFVDKFVEKMYANYLEWGSLTTGQEEAVKKAFSRIENKKAEYKAAKLEEAKNSEFIGEVGSRIEIKNLKLLAVYSNPTDFGYQHVHKFKQEETGNLVVWKASNKLLQLPGEILSLKATVKSHWTSQEGIKTTYVNRASVI